MVNFSGNNSIKRNPYLIFLPFLLLYAAFVILLQHHELWGDETRHFMQAENLLKGFYSPPAPNIDLGNGPGYPIFILPFVAFHMPLLLIKLMNAVFLYLTIVFLFKIMTRYVNFTISLVFCLFWGFYFNSLNFIALIYAETFSVFLVTLLLLLLVKLFETTNRAHVKRYILLSGFIFGYLALTKFIFGYVILFMLAGCFFLWLMNRKEVNYRKGLMVLLVASVTVTPYLVYTYNLTGKVFYWSTSGGNNLYWMSSPYEGEYGNWFSGNTILSNDTILNSKDVNKKMVIAESSGLINNGLDSLKAHHRKNYEEFYSHKGVEIDDAFRKAVMKNIREHPGKFIQNCFSNIGRMLFNYPYSYSAQKPATLARLPLNGTIVLLALFCLVPTFVNWRRVLYPIRFMLFFTLLYLGGSVFGSAELRMFTVIVPVLLFWIAYMIQRTVKVNWKFKQEDSL